MSSDLLFISGKLYEFLDTRVAKMKEAIERYDGNQLLNPSPEDLVTYFVALGRVEPLNLLDNGRRGWGHTFVSLGMFGQVALVSC
jgi:hypothetical protein